MRRSYKGIPINTSKNTHETVYNLLPGNYTESKILDIPSGAGAFTLRLKDNGYQQIYAADIANVLQIEHQHFTKGDMNKPLPFEDESLDAVVCIDGIEHISRQFDFVREVNRVLKPNGYFLVSTPNISSVRSRVRWLLTGHHNKCKSPLNELKPDFSHHIGMISFPEIRYLLHTNDFTIEQIATNQIKPVSWLYMPLIPFLYAATFWVYQHEAKDKVQRKINRSILQEVFSKPVLFGETMIIKAKKQVKMTPYK